MKNKIHYYKHEYTGEYYREGKDQKHQWNLINALTGSEYYLPGDYLEVDKGNFFPFKEVSEAEFNVQTSKKQSKTN